MPIPILNQPRLGLVAALATLTATLLAGCGGGGGGGGGGSTSFVPLVADTPIATAVSAVGHDRLYGVVFDDSGSMFAAGVVSDAATTTADFATIVVKLRPNGTLDTTYGTGGVARVNLAVGGTSAELARGIVLQSSGKIVVSATVEHLNGGDPRDRDIALARFNTNGTLDTTFGTNGIKTLDLSTGAVDGAGFVADASWSLHRFSNDDLLVTGSRKADGRLDSDFAIVRLNANGAEVTTFGTNGVFSLDIANGPANPRNATILANGSIVATGYTTIGGVVSPVLFKLTPQGALDTSFGNGGVFNQNILALVTEVYGAALQGDSFVTAGYGRSSASESIDWLSLRITANGQLDTTYGSNGVARIDASGFNDNARAVSVLADGRVVLVGGGRTSASDVDGMVAVLTPNGQRDTTFAPDGFQLFNLGGPADFFWGVAVSPNQDRIAVVGITTSATPGAGDDTSLMFIER